MSVWWIDWPDGVVEQAASQVDRLLINPNTDRAHVDQVAQRLLADTQHQPTRAAILWQVAHVYAQSDIQKTLDAILLRIEAALTQLVDLPRRR